MTPNESAFLDVISHAEGTDRAPDPYRVCFGFKHTIVDLSEHPAVTGEWKGESLAFLGPGYANSISTAAGRYQINKPSWETGQAALGLTDFMPASQDAWALWKLDKLGATGLIEAGLIHEAIIVCSGTWASLPGSPAGQPQQRLADLIDLYTQHGGLAEA